MERYKAYSTHLKELYGEKVYKLPVNLPVTCPNRMDGDGCTFCGGVGTGFEAMNSEVHIRLNSAAVHLIWQSRQKMDGSKGGRYFRIWFLDSSLYYF